MVDVYQTAMDQINAKYLGARCFWGCDEVARAVIDVLKEAYPNLATDQFRYRDYDSHNHYTVQLEYKGYSIGKLDCKRTITKKGSRYSYQEYAYKSFELELWTGGETSLTDRLIRIEQLAAERAQARADERQYMKKLFAQIQADRGLSEYEASEFIKRLNNARYSLS